MSTLLEILQEKDLKEIEEKWPNGINMENKTQFLGFSHDALDGAPEVYLSIEMLRSDKWGFTFRPLDKEFIGTLNELFEAMGGSPSASEVRELGWDHPCRQTCSGWRQGYDRGRYEAKKQIDLLKRICRDLASSSKSKRTQSYVRFFEKHFKEEGS